MGKFFRITIALFSCLTLLCSAVPSSYAADPVPPVPGMRIWPPPDLDAVPPTPGGKVETITADDQVNTATSYVLGRGDQITITDYGSQDLRHAFNTQTATILSDGTASIYPIGVVRAAGQTLQQLNALVNEKAKSTWSSLNFLWPSVEQDP